MLVTDDKLCDTEKRRRMEVAKDGFHKRNNVLRFFIHLFYRLSITCRLFKAENIFLNEIFIFFGKRILH